MREAKILEASQELRENNPNLMQLYKMFVPEPKKRGLPRYLTDQWGSRVLVEEYELTPEGIKRKNHGPLDSNLAECHLTGGG